MSGLGEISTIVRVVGTEFDLAADVLPAYGEDRVYVWLVVPAWSTVRALRVPGTPFLRAFWEWDGVSEVRQETLLTDVTGCVRASLRGYVDELTGRRFMCRIELPDFRPISADERVPVADVRLALAPPAGWMT